MPTFEYKAISINMADKKLEKKLNDLGKEGWELVSVTPTGLAIEGWTNGTFPHTCGETNGGFTNITAFFKRIKE